MNIALIGYGKMGKTIERLAKERDHSVGLRITEKNTGDLNTLNEHQIDVAIEFTTPTSAVQNIYSCIEQNMPVVVGTTGWYEELKDVEAYCRANDGSMLYASNFSIGVNLFFELNKKLAQLMNHRREYQASMTEIHHTEKVDSPSGTAITLAEHLIANHEGFQKWNNSQEKIDKSLLIHSIREKGVPGTHKVDYQSEIDSITIEHQAKNRNGFALGAILAAEFIQTKKGVFTMKDLLNF